MRRERAESAEILIIDDDPGLSFLLQSVLERGGHHARIARTGREALGWLKVHEADLLIIDYRLPDMSADRLIDHLEESGLDVEFLIVTGYGDERIAVQMMKRGARDYLCKDARLLESIPQVVSHVLSERARDRRLAVAERTLDLYAAALRQAHEAIAILELAPHGGARVLFANAAFSDLVGVRELPGTDFEAFLVEQEGARGRAHLLGALTARIQFEGVVQLVHPRHGGFDTLLQLTPIGTRDADPLHAIVSLRPVAGAAGPRARGADDGRAAHDVLEPLPRETRVPERSDLDRTRTAPSRSSTRRTDSEPASVTEVETASSPAAMSSPVEGSSPAGFSSPAAASSGASVAPSTRATDAAVASASHAERGAASPTSPPARLWVVEDELLVRELIAKTLRRAGYEVESAEDPLAALDRLADGVAAPDLVVVDLVMPSMSGTAFVARLHESHPGVRVIYTSGYSEDEELRAEQDAGRGVFLPKPFAPADLLRLVEQALRSAITPTAE